MRTEFDLKAEGREIRVLNLYAGIGGNRKLWPENVKVTSVELDPAIAEVYKHYFPNDTLIVGDAHQYLLDHYSEFDFIWASPPCTTHTRMNKNFAKTKNGIGQINPRYPDMKLYQEILFLDNFFEGKYCVENVIPYYEPLIPAKQRHRHLYWCNFRIPTTSKANPEKEMPLATTRVVRKKGFIKEDSAILLAKKFGFEPFDKNVYINGNHSPGQMFRNCVDPKEGLLIFQCAVGAFKSNSIHQPSLWNVEL
jgi:DNA (cytosine-5)-methyltransferase 1